MSAIDLEKLAITLMFQHGLIQTGWKFEFRNQLTPVAHCDYYKKTIRYCVHRLNREDEHIRNTILHEIAHALVGPYVKSHGKEWKAKARSIGCTGDRCTGDAHNIDISRANYRMYCPVCNKEWLMNRRPIMSGRYHTQCGKEAKLKLESFKDECHHGRDSVCMKCDPETVASLQRLTNKPVTLVHFGR